MNMNIYLICFGTGILGILFHVFALKLPALKKRCNAAGKDFSVRDYVKDDWLALSSSVLSLLISIVVLDEVVKFKPFIVEYLKFFFVFVGYTGSSVLQSILGKTDRALNKMINDSPDLANKEDGNGAVIPDKGP